MTIIIPDRVALEHQIIMLNQQQGWSIRTLAWQFGASRKLLPASRGAELSRLQRCNQERLLVVIRLLPARLGAELSRLQRYNQERLVVVIRLLPASLGAERSRLQRCNQERPLVVIRLLPASLGAERSRLQRCNQERLLVVIREHGLTWRETRQVVTVLLTKAPQKYEAILSNPRATLIKPPETPRCVPDAMVSLCRLSGWCAACGLWTSTAGRWRRCSAERKRSGIAVQKSFFHLKL
jgi:hypothetical protein